MIEEEYFPQDTWIRKDLSPSINKNLNKKTDVKTTDINNSISSSKCTKPSKSWEAEGK